MRKHKKSRPKSAKGERYKVKNWREYNRSLKNRGSLIFWLPKKLEPRWYYHGKARRGSPFVYSDFCIELCCIIRKVYHLPYRQTQGLIQSVFQLAGIELTVPDSSVICRRSKYLQVALPGLISDQAIDVVMDSTGLKVYGEGEWKVRIHGRCKHRTWRKIHLAADPKTGLIQAGQMTTNSISDGEMVRPLLEQLRTKVKKLAADGAYDQHKVYNELKRRKIYPLIPPKKNARILKHKNARGRTVPRDRNLRLIRSLGRKEWKKQSGYHKRSLVENIMYRYKTILGDKLQARDPIRQNVETMICCKILNRMNLAGMPICYKIAS